MLYQHAYNCDNIGNRITANENGSRKNYTTNALNQYTSNTGFTPTYDLDGNQKKIKTSTGEWEVTYNGENRPVKFIQGDKTLEMKYDYMGRRVELLSKEGSLVRKHSRFMYKDYTLTQELSNTNTVSSAFIWDPTAGMATKPLIFKYDNSAFYYTHDGNKNVAELISADNSALVCHYEYSPFGQTVVSAMTSPQPIPGFIFTYPAYDKLNPFRFSSEYHDDELGLIYYNYRHYNTADGRWLSRDIAGEIGGINLYGFIYNTVFGYVDVLGTSMYRVLPSGFDTRPDKPIIQNPPGIPPAPYPPPPPDIETISVCENVINERSGGNMLGKFELQVDRDNCIVNVMVDIYYDMNTPISHEMINKIKKVWDNKFKICCRGEKKCPDGFSVNFIPNFIKNDKRPLKIQEEEHCIQVDNTRNRPCVTIWNTGGKWETGAHEFGHMVGASDSYDPQGIPYKDILSVMNNDKLELLLPNDYQFIAEKMGKGCKVCPL